MKLKRTALAMVFIAAFTAIAFTGEAVWARRVVRTVWHPQPVVVVQQPVFVSPPVVVRQPVVVAPRRVYRPVYIW